MPSLFNQALRQQPRINDSSGRLAAIGSPLVKNPPIETHPPARYINGAKRPDAYWLEVGAPPDINPVVLSHPGVHTETASLLYLKRATDARHCSIENQRTYYGRLYAQLSCPAKAALARLWSAFHNNDEWPTQDEFAGRISTNSDAANTLITELTQKGFVDVAQPDLGKTSRFIIPKTDIFGNPLTLDEMMTVWRQVTARWHEGVRRAGITAAIDLDDDDRTILNLLTERVRVKNRPCSISEICESEALKVRYRPNTHQRLIKLFTLGFIDLVRDPNGTRRLFPILKMNALGRPLTEDAILAQFARLVGSNESPEQTLELYRDSLHTRINRSTKDVIGTARLQRYLLCGLSEKLMPPTTQELAALFGMSESGVTRLVHSLVATGTVMWSPDPVTRSQRNFVIVLREDDTTYLPSPDVAWQFTKINDKKAAMARLGPTQRLVLEGIVHLGNNVRYKDLNALFSGSTDFDLIDPSGIRTACTQLRDMGFIKIEAVGRGWTVLISPLV